MDLILPWEDVFSKKKRPLELLVNTGKQRKALEREKHYMLNMSHVVWHHLYFLSDFRAIPYTEHP